MRSALLLVLLASCARPSGPPNLVLVSVDTLRADHLSCYGASGSATPHFDRIAREGVLFENVSSVAPTTLPAHASLFTGVLPPEHQVRDNVGFRLGEELPTLASFLKEKGYRTGGFVGSFVLDSRFGLDRGFDRYADEMPKVGRGLTRRAERDGGEVLDEAIRWMAQESGSPFFAFIHLFDPHRPYDPPEAFEPGTQDPLARYRGEVVYVDSLLGKLLSFLEGRGLLDKTVLVVTADHGESLGEHGEDTHGFYLYQSTLRVPLLVRGPSVPRGERIDALARTIDVAPTSLEVLGFEPPSSFEGKSFLSRSGELRSPELEAYGETFVPRLHFGWSELRSLRRGNWKLVLAPSIELYDLASDPEESENLAPEEPDLVSELQSRLESRERPAEVRPERVDERTLASLRALGYLGGLSAEAGGELSDPKHKIGLYNEILALSAIEEPEPSDLARLEAVLEQEPENPRALSLHGRFLLALSRPREAKESFERLLASHAESFDGRFGLGRALMALGETEAAREQLERARSLEPDNSAVLATLAALDETAGELEAAERRLREAIALDPDPAYHRELGEILASRGRGAEALVELERAVELAPEDDDAEQALANELTRLGRFDEAAARYRSILRRSPCYLGALTNLGAAYERSGKVEEAIRSYEEAIGCDPGYAAAHRNLGAALARKGDLARALEVLKRARALSPDDRELAEAVAELEGMLR